MIIYVELLNKSHLTHFRKISFVTQYPDDFGFKSMQCFIMITKIDIMKHNINIVRSIVSN